MSVEAWGIVVPAVVSVGSAIWAYLSAKRARSAEQAAARLLAAEERTAEKKFKIYEPFITGLGEMLVPETMKAANERMLKLMPQFQTDITTWGSDEAVAAFVRFRRASNFDPPPNVIMRLVADLLVAIRRDIAVPNSRVTPMEVIGYRITDLKPGGPLARALEMPFAELCKQEHWTPPFPLGKEDRR